jgi:hypothetical protein
MLVYQRVTWQQLFVSESVHANFAECTWMLREMIWTFHQRSFSLKQEGMSMYVDHLYMIGGNSK